VRLLGLITRLAAVRQTPDHIGEPSRVVAIAAARSPPQWIEYALVLATPDTEFDALPELVFDPVQTWTAKQRMIR